MTRRSYSIFELVLAPAFRPYPQRDSNPRYRLERAAS
jgi:hypothetical protein